MGWSRMAEAEPLALGLGEGADWQVYIQHAVPFTQPR